MFLRRIERRKNGKTHLYWSVVENKRLDGGRVVQRHVLYLGEINSSQAETWRKAVEVFDAEAGGSQTLALFPEDRCEAVADDSSVVRLRLSDLRLHRPRQWGACWLAGQLWRDLQLDRFWAERLPASRKRTRWDHVLQVLVAYRLIEPGSEWRLHREWFGNSAMADLLGSDFGLAEAHKLYACHDLLLAHKEAVFPQSPNKSPGAAPHDRFCGPQWLRRSQLQVVDHLLAFVVAQGESRRHGVQPGRVAPLLRAHGASPPFQRNGARHDCAAREPAV